ncbi:MAG: PilN domain-containing protein [Myxococcota bacterium]|nr:PilN domain-containing protein [Myxococcota bacterium]
MFSVLVATWLLVGPVVGQPTTLLLGSSDSEGPGHFWGMWVSAEGLWSHGPFVRVTERINLPEAFRADMADPLNTVVFWVVWTLGGRGVGAGVLAWNLLFAGTVVLVGLGGCQLSESPQPDASTPPEQPTLAVQDTDATKAVIWAALQGVVEARTIDIEITELSVGSEPTPTVELSGSAASNQVISELLEALEKQPQFTNVYLAATEIAQVGDTERQMFQVTASHAAP